MASQTETQEMFQEVPDDEFEPQMRSRCGTWPMQRPHPTSELKMSPLMQERIDEEPDLTDGGQLPPDLQNLQITADNALFTGQSTDDVISNGHQQTCSPGRLSGEEGGPKKSGGSRKNAWGNMSYADLITQAVMSAPEHRLTLAQIYDWMIQNVPYFRDKADSNSSAGWKNSIRHNLSLHSRFVRVQNDGAGKSSWWMVNPDAKQSKASRRRATMSGDMKNGIEKRRGRVRANKRQADTLKPGTGDNSMDGQPEYTTEMTSFRQRSCSNLSTYSVGSRASECELPESLVSWSNSAAQSSDTYPDIVQGISSTCINESYQPNNERIGAFAKPQPSKCSDYPAATNIALNSRIHSAQRSPVNIKTETSCHLYAVPQQTSPVDNSTPPYSTHSPSVKLESTSHLPTYSDLYPHHDRNVQWQQHQPAPMDIPSSHVHDPSMMPTELNSVFQQSQMECNTELFSNTNIEDIFRHELRVDGKLDFITTDANFA